MAMSTADTDMKKIYGTDTTADDFYGYCNDGEPPQTFTASRVIADSRTCNNSFDVNYYFNIDSSVLDDLDSQALTYKVVFDKEVADYPKYEGTDEYGYTREKGRAYFLVCSGNKMYDATDILTTSSKTFTVQYYVHDVDPDDYDPPGCPSAGSATFNYQNYSRCDKVFAGDCGHTGDCGEAPAFYFDTPSLNYPVLPQED